MSARFGVLAALLLACGEREMGSDAGPSTPATILSCEQFGCLWLDASQSSSVILDGGVLSVWKSALRPGTLLSTSNARPKYWASTTGITYSDNVLAVGATRGILMLDGLSGRSELQYIVASIDPSNSAFLVGTDPLLVVNDDKSDAGVRLCFGVFPGSYPVASMANCLDSPSSIWRDGQLHFFAVWADHDRNRFVFMIDRFEQYWEGHVFGGDQIVEIGGHTNPMTDAGAELVSHVMEGRVAEVFKYGHPVSLAQMTAIRNYITQKFGIKF